MHVSGPDTYWLGQKVKGQGHSRRRQNRRRQPVEFHQVLSLIFSYICAVVARFWTIIKHCTQNCLSYELHIVTYRFTNIIRFVCPNGDLFECRVVWCSVVVQAQVQRRREDQDDWKHVHGCCRSAATQHLLQGITTALKSDLHANKLIIIT